MTEYPKYNHYKKVLKTNYNFSKALEQRNSNYGNNNNQPRNFSNTILRTVF